MTTDFLFETLEASPDFAKVSAFLKGGNRAVYLSGLSDAQKAFYTASLAKRVGRPFVVLCGSDKASSSFYDDLSELLQEPVCLLPPREMTFYQNVASSRELTNRRLETMHRSLSGEARIIVATADALLHRLMPRERFLSGTTVIRTGDVLDFKEITARLSRAGYTMEDMVEGRGQFSARGGVLDVYPVHGSEAVRIDFFDNEVDSIRTFDLQTQRSLNELEAVTIPPACEALLPEDTERIQRLFEELIGSLDAGDGEEGESELGSLPAEGDSPRTPSKAFVQTREGFRLSLQRLLETVRENGASKDLERYIHLLYGRTETILDYLDDPIVVLMEPVALRERLQSRTDEFNHSFTSALERGEAARQQGGLLYTVEEWLAAVRRRSVLLEADIPGTAAGFEEAVCLETGGVTIGSYNGRIRDMCTDIGKWQKEKYRVLIFAGGTARGERMCASLADEGITARLQEGDAAPGEGECVILPLTLSGGFRFPKERLAVLVESDVYGASRTETRRKKNKGSKLNAFTDLRVGDYVVHETHGIGRYEGIKRLTGEGVSRDYLMIQYLGSDKLYIPVDHFDRIQKYIGSGEATVPKLSHLGGKDWDRQKQKVRASLKELAFDLIGLYKERQHNKGHAFAKDTLWQAEFEENFPFEETEDQITATEDIKRDMEREQPMDRLLCGDVGYGKTEVALRAVFKAVMDGYQVAMLAPTTILVQQHYQTMCRRFEGFPVHVDVLSRFKTQKEQKQTLERVRSGEVDVLIGTHRLLAKDVQFKKLGLLVVDEEQRFGVGHKEQIKNLKNTIDVLTLSATPIPRTLHMSMVGIRDMSLLETPPQERFPVQTYVIEYQDSIIRDAILREINRGGQVFFLYNRVESIERCYAALSKLVPEARIVIAHGQMRENTLEDVMLDFSRHEYDVLLCTTIIESGLDIPLANTLIVYDADHFGLGQLYQMRGRVGRSNRMAYAYLTVRPNHSLSENAQERLNAIREFTEFGSGFKIAMRDLEIRGAGNVLGPQQSGHLANIGYDLYCKLLEEAVSEARGEKPRANRELDTRMDVAVNAYLPADYVSGDRQRLEVYKRIASIQTADQRDDLEEELLDRFGEEPTSVANLVSVAYLKSLCRDLGIQRVLQKPGQLEMMFSPTAEIDGTRLFTAIMGLDRRLVLRSRPLPKLILTDPHKSNEEMLRFAVGVMERLTSRMAGQAG